MNFDAIDSVRSLLKEYTTKLQNLDVAEPGDQMYLQKLMPSARKLAQFVSQNLNNVDGAGRLELELRLAEFEIALTQAGFPRKRSPR